MSAPPIKLIVGLGNPGAEYIHSRHNVGVWFLEALAKQESHHLKKENKFYGFITKFHQGWLFKPSTYMNESGRAVFAVANFYKIEPQEILVAHDELDFPVGVIHLKKDGGHAGHNGLRDIIRYLGSADFYRWRIGIGHPGHKDRVTPYVLSAPGEGERADILSAIEKGLSVTQELMQGEFEKAKQI